MPLMDHAIKKWQRFVTDRVAGVNLKVFVGEIGVGKTHFLSVFLHEIKQRHADLYNRTVLVRAELVERIGTACWMCNAASLALFTRSWTSD